VLLRRRNDGSRGNGRGRIDGIVGKEGHAAVHEEKRGVLELFKLPKSRAESASSSQVRCEGNAVAADSTAVW